MAENFRQDLGSITPYAVAVDNGYEGTEAEYNQAITDLGNIQAEATTLPVGSPATASYEDGVLSLGLPLAEYDDSELQNDMSVLEARMDAFSSLAEGSTTGDAELIDIRVGADGVTYSNAGTAVRTQITDLKSDLKIIDNELGKEIIKPIFRNGTPANSGNTTAICFKNMFPVSFGQVLELCTDRPNLEGYHYVYGNHIYNSSSAEIGGSSYPNGYKAITIQSTSQTQIKFALAERKDDNSGYNPLRVTDFENYHVWLKVSDGSKQTLEDLIIAEDNIIPLMRNGSRMNSGNANAICTFYTIPINNAKSMQIEYLGELPEGGHILWNIAGLRATAKGKTSGDTASDTIGDYDITGGTDETILTLNTALTWNSLKNAKYMTVALWVYDENNTLIPQRVGKDGCAIKIRYFNDESIVQLRNDLQTIIPRDSYAYLSDEGSFIFKDYPRFGTNGRCAWRVTSGISVGTPKVDPFYTRIDDIISQIDSNDVVTVNGLSWISIRTGYALVVDISTKTFKTKQFTSGLLNTELPILLTWSKQIIGGLLGDRFMNEAYMTKPTLFNGSNVLYDIDVKEKATEFTDIISANTDSESFLFFTDPHTYGHNYNETKAEYLQTVIQKYYHSTPTSFVLCGGDWLENSDTKAEAKYKMGLIDASMKAMVNPYYPIFGNHDSNYQGAETLSNGEVVNLWFKKWGKTYYTFEGTSTRFYVFDSQLDGVLSMDSYAWEQIDWFASSLEEETKEHIAIAIHIWKDTNGIAPLAQNISEVVTAYNKRNSVTLNGRTYSFTSATGHIEFAIAGHTHSDINYAIDNSVPVIITKNTNYGNTSVDFDLVFADYVARTINCIRVGSGNNRKFSLDTGEVIS